MSGTKVMNEGDSQIADSRHDLRGIAGAIFVHRRMLAAGWQTYLAVFAESLEAGEYALNEHGYLDPSLRVDRRQSDTGREFEIDLKAGQMDLLLTEEHEEGSG